MAQEIGQLPILLSLISEGVGVAVAPASIRNVRRAGVAYRRIEEQTPLVDLSLAWRRDDESTVLRAFLETFAEVSRQSGQEAWVMRRCRNSFAGNNSRCTKRTPDPLDGGPG